MPGLSLPSYSPFRCLGMLCPGLCLWGGWGRSVYGVPERRSCAGWAMYRAVQERRHLSSGRPAVPWQHWPFYAVHRHHSRPVGTHCRPADTEWPHRPSILLSPSSRNAQDPVHRHRGPRGDFWNVFFMRHFEAYKGSRTVPSGSKRWKGVVRFSWPSGLSSRQATVCPGFDNQPST